MLRFIKGGDLRYIKADAVVIPVNTVGVMGCGLALYYRKAVPGLYAAFKHACMMGHFRTNELFTYSYDNVHYICFPTKEDWKNPSTLDRVDKSLRALHQFMDCMGGCWYIDSIVIPPVGCGYGGLDYMYVKPLLEHYFTDKDYLITVCEPS